MNNTHVKFWSDGPEVPPFHQIGQGSRTPGKGDTFSYLLRWPSRNKEKLTLKLSFDQTSWAHMEEYPYQSIFFLENSSGRMWSEGSHGFETELVPPRAPTPLKPW